MKKILIIGVLIVIYMFYKTSNINYIPTESIRFRIIPNSNNVEDIFIKEKVLENISTEINGYNSSSIEEARDLISSKINSIDSKVEEIFNKYNYDKNYEIKFGYNYFPQKTYNNKTYDEGYYESLVIELGEAKGDNFWCVLFPPLCMLEIEETEKDNIEYSFFLKEIFNKIFD